MKKTLYEGEHLRFVDDDTWEYVDRRNGSGVVIILAVTAAGKLILVEQYRPAVARRVIELPAGLAGDHAGGADESLETAACRELVEETGYEASDMELLATGVPSAGVTSEENYVFRACGLERVGDGGGDASEDIEVHEVPLDGVEEWLAAQQRTGKAIDLKVWAGLYFARGMAE